MGVLPVSVSRTSDLLTHQRLQAQLQQTQLELQDLYDQLSTGRRVRVASDDAPAATRALLLQRSLQYSTQLVRNADATDRLLSATDGLLSDVSDQLSEVRASANEAAQSVISSSERSTLAQSVRESLSQIVNAGNRTFEGHFLLSGSKKVTPFEENDNYVRWNAGEQPLSSFAAKDRVTPSSSTVIDAFGLKTNQIRSSTDFRPAITATTLLADLDGGVGVQPGPFRVLDTTGNTWKTVDLSGVQTVGDLQDVIGDVSVGGRPLDVSINGGKLELRFADNLPGSLAVEDLPGGKVVQQFGWTNPVGALAPPLGNQDLTPLLGVHTRIDEAASGVGLNLQAGIQLRQGNETFAVDLSQAETIGDVINAIHRSGADVHAGIDPESGQLVVQSLRSGVDFAIGENGGTVAAQLGLRTATLATELGELNYGEGLHLTNGTDFSIVRPDGVQLDVDLNGLSTIADVISAINNHVGNTGPGQVTASLAAIGNGIALTAASGAGEIRVLKTDASDAAVALGLVAKGQSVATGSTSGGTASLQGADYNGRPPGGLIDTMWRLQSAIATADYGEIGRLQALMDESTDELASVQAQIGLHSQATAATKVRLEDDEVRLKAGISENIEADLTEVVSQVALRQAALEASLRLVGQTAQMTVLNFL